MRLAGKRAFVTGAAKGLGAAIVRAFSGEGALVAIADIDAIAASALSQEIIADGGSALALSLDVAEATGWDKAVDEVGRHWSGIDILVNNAAIASGLTSIEDRTPEGWDRSMAINAKGPFLGTRAMLPIFREQGGGTIVNVSSVAGLGQCQIMDAAYACSKAALTMLTRITAAQHSGEGVRCNSVHPGPIDSPMARIAYADTQLLANRLQRVPIGRLAEIEEVVAAILFLASDESSYITGAALAVDGGALVQ